MGLELNSCNNFQIRHTITTEQQEAIFYFHLAFPVEKKVIYSSRKKKMNTTVNHSQVGLSWLLIVCVLGHVTFSHNPNRTLNKNHNVTCLQTLEKMNVYTTVWIKQTLQNGSVTKFMSFNLSVWCFLQQPTLSSVIKSCMENVYKFCS